jgi:hypothetical protein
VPPRCQTTPQTRRGLRDRGPAGVNGAGHREEPVRHARVAAEFDLNAVVGEPTGVSLALIAQRVILRGDDKRRRQPGEAGGAQWRG